MIANKRTGKVLARDYVWCKNSVSKARGLMFRREAVPLLMDFSRERRRGLHMCFVFFPIDVAFMDSEGRVVEIKEDFRPFTTYKPGQKSKYILELPAGTIGTTKTRVGDHLKIYKGKVSPSEQKGA
ncbi:MAG: DUF192 domain-containing protein [Candidatus Woesearchaeota archaeon]